MNELFTIEEVTQDSPRLAWLKAHGLEVVETGALSGLEDDFGEEVPQWICRVVKPSDVIYAYSPNELDGGDTVDEACANLAKARGIKLWNEE